VSQGMPTIDQYGGEAVVPPLERVHRHLHQESQGAGVVVVVGAAVLLCKHGFLVGNPFCLHQVVSRMQQDVGRYDGDAHRHWADPVSVPVYTVPAYWPLCTHRRQPSLMRIH